MGAWGKTVTAGEHVVTRRLQPAQPQPQKRGWSAGIWVEVLFLALGLVLLAAFCANHVDSYLSSRAAMKQLAAAQSRLAPDPNSKTPTLAFLDAPTGSLADDEIAPPADIAPGTPLGILRIPGIQLEQPVLAGTDSPHPQPRHWLDRRHRPPRRVRQHRSRRPSRQLLSRPQRREDRRRNPARYKAGSGHLHRRSHRIVMPEDISVLNPGPVSELTLVTCYPFHYIGNAPQRYIVIAHSASSQ